MNPIMKVTAFVNFYSGRPNPSWILDDAEVFILRSKVQRLKKVKPRPFPVRAGYNGFTLLQDGSISDLPRLIQISDGTVILYKDSSKLNQEQTYRADSQGLETWLKCLAVEQDLGKYLVTETVIRKGQCLGQSDK